ncbi:alpha/beta hydrolase [Kitasatospora sp. MAP5-34]|uniref:alpha/beta fold hydrolase n=1 Tax=Kitasatospora sp. MAP5-34 TaxID=3035102 RepID=UPI00247455B4|nr:alpha/beta hydrolase [Kitasatospora sp. MAP5-34]MDH6575951.1 pimeloyl-ACP methyl ester carboxylesterase [Kitasatospora sp. MAP5-34]
MPEVGANGVSLYYESQGTGPGVVLVHGSWSDADSWSRVVPGLATGCTVVAYDRRGHSRSEDPGVQGSVHEDVADLAGLIEALGLAPAFVCGNSYGGLITLRLAAVRPELVRGITVHEPPGVELIRADPGLSVITGGFAERIAPVRVLLEAGESAAAAELFVETVALGPGAWLQLPAPLRHTFVRNAPTFLDELRDPEALALDLTALAGYTAPVLLTRSDGPAPLFEPVLDRIALTLPHAEIHVYLGAGHVPHVTQPEEYVRVVLPRALARP